MLLGGAVVAAAMVAQAAASTARGRCSLANNTAYDTAAPGISPVSPLHVVPNTGSAAACCGLCAAHSGCTYFTLYPNRTCALLGMFGAPRSIAGAISGSTTTHPAPTGFVQHRDAALLAALRSLPRLPKPHFAWPILPTGDVAFYTADPYVHEFTRITRAISFSAEFANRERTFMIVQAAAAANASIGIHFWGLWRRIFPAEAPPTYCGPEAAAEMERFRALMQNCSDWLAEANAHYSTAVRVGLVMLDVERFRTEGNGSAWDAAITAKHTATFRAAKRIFPAVELDWFGRGGCHRGPLPEAKGGWWCGEAGGNFFTLQEPADAFSVTQYTLWEPGFRREAMRRTVEAVSVAAAAGAAPGRPIVHTFISLGAGNSETPRSHIGRCSVSGRCSIDMQPYVIPR
eukprot:SAG11_NODE_300_length_11057_cov_5.223469_2_plen_402_part_00